jgi:hypothetical protein
MKLADYIDSRDEPTSVLERRLADDAARNLARAVAFVPEAVDFAEADWKKLADAFEDFTEADWLTLRRRKMSAFTDILKPAAPAPSKRTKATPPPADDPSKTKKE